MYFCLTEMIPPTMATDWPGLTENERLSSIGWPGWYWKLTPANSIPAFSLDKRRGKLFCGDTILGLTVINWNITLIVVLRNWEQPHHHTPYLHVYQGLPHLPVHWAEKTQGDRKLEEKSINHDLGQLANIELLGETNSKDIHQASHSHLTLENVMGSHDHDTRQSSAIIRYILKYLNLETYITYFTWILNFDRSLKKLSSSWFLMKRPRIP